MGEIASISFYAFGWITGLFLGVLGGFMLGRKCGWEEYKKAVVEMVEKMIKEQEDGD